MKKKNLFVSVVAIVLVLCCAIGGSLAWLTDKTEDVANIFTVGDINITLTESTDTYKVLPGKEIAKDPKVTVKADSEDCYVFVEIKEENFNKLEYAVAEDWKQLKEGSNVYYQTVNVSDEDQAFYVLKDNKVIAPSTLTAEDLKDMGTNQPKLTFTAYAIQYYSGENAEGNKTYFTPEEAWEKVSAQNA